MKNKNFLFGFTLAELLVSIAIFSIIILGLSLALVQIGENLSSSSKQMEIYGDFRQFIFDSYRFDYSTGLLINSGSTYSCLLLYNQSGGVVNGDGIVIGVFDDNSSNSNFQLSDTNSIYKKQYFGYFKINKNILPSVLSNTGSIYTIKFNNGKLFKKVLVKDFKIISFNNDSLFSLKLTAYIDFSSDYVGLNKSNLIIPKDSLININFNF